MKRLVFFSHSHRFLSRKFLLECLRSVCSCSQPNPGFATFGQELVMKVGFG